MRYVINVVCACLFCVHEVCAQALRVGADIAITQASVDFDMKYLQPEKWIQDHTMSTFLSLFTYPANVRVASAFPLQGSNHVMSMFFLRLYAVGNLARLFSVVPEEPKLCD